MSDKEWTLVKPTAPGAFWIRGNNLRHPALVEVGTYNGVLSCNLHQYTTDTGLGYSIEQLSDQFEWCGPLVVEKYPISHGSHIIQFHDETFVWYDESGLHGGLAYSLEQAQRDLQRYAESLNAPKLDPAVFAPITQPGYAEGEIPHQFGDLMEYAGKLQEQNEAMRDVMAKAGMCISLAKARNPAAASVRISRSLAQRLQERMDPHRDAKDWHELCDAVLGTSNVTCKHCGWPHINVTETCDDATARERGNHV